MKQAIHHKKSNMDYDSVILRRTLIGALILIIGVLLGVISFTVYRINLHETYAGKIIGYDEVQTSVIVTPDSVGLNGDTTSLKFGLVTAGSGGTRFLIVNATQDAILEVYFSGDMQRFLSVEKNQYLITKGTSEKVAINLNVPEGTKPAEYDGKVHIVLLKP